MKTNTPKPRKRFRGRPNREVIEKSCGVILFRQIDSGREYLLLHYPGGHWDFPKGHVEEIDENEMGTAHRELVEETGIEIVEFDPDYHEAMYYEFNRGRKERVKKTVVYFVAEAFHTDVTLSFEHKDYIWLPFKESFDKLTFENAKDLIEKAEKHLTK